MLLMIRRATPALTKFQHAVEQPNEYEKYMAAHDSLRVLLYFLLFFFLAHLFCGREHEKLHGMFNTCTRDQLSVIGRERRRGSDLVGMLPRACVCVCVCVQIRLIFYILFLCLFFGIRAFNATTTTHGMGVEGGIENVKKVTQPSFLGRASADGGQRYK